MPFRRMLLQVMLWALGIGAVLGALTILVGELSGIWRVSVTILAAAGAAGLMIPCSVLMDRRKSRPAGLLGTTVILAEFFLSVLLIWELAELLPWKGPYGRVALTMLFAFLCTVPAMYFLTARNQAVARIAADTGVALTGVAFALALLGCWLPGSFDEEWFETIGMLVIFGHIAVFCLIGINRQASFGPAPMFLVRVVGVIAAAAAQAIATYAIWQHIYGDSTVFTLFVCIGGVVAHANLCLLAPLTDPQRWMRWVTITGGVATGVFVSLLVIWDGALVPDDIMIRMASAAGFVASCGSLAMLVMTRMNKRMADEVRVLEDIKEITVICPGCKKQHTLPVGEAACPTCRLELHLRVVEPHCPKCDFSLFMLTSNRCPECGQAVSAPRPPPNGGDEAKVVGFAPGAGV